MYEKGMITLTILRIVNAYPNIFVLIPCGGFYINDLFI